MKQFGMGAQVDQLETSMNKAAEAAVPQAQALLVNAVKNMSVADAKGILSGDGTPATQYLAKAAAIRSAPSSCQSSSTPPTRSAWPNGTTPSPGRPPRWVWWTPKSANIESYVTEKALDGLFEMIGKQEETIAEPGSGGYQFGQEGVGTL